MVLLLVLAGTTAVAWLLGRRHGTLADHARRGMAGAMIVAGVAHLVSPDPFVQHLPDWVPAREGIVLVTGLVEIALGAALFAPRRWRPLAGIVLAAYLLAVWPANIYVAVAGVEVDGQPGGIYPWLRLPFQVLFIWWALRSTAPPTSAESDHGRPAVAGRR